MQVVSKSTPAAKFHVEDRFADLSGKLSEDFGSKLKIDGIEEEDRIHLEESRRESEESDGEGEEEDETGDDDDDEEEDEEEEEEEEEFSFVGVNLDGSPITAEEAFKDGQIRPVFPLFNRDLLFDGDNHTNNNADSRFNDKNPTLRLPLKKLFVEDRDGGDAATTSDSDPQGPYCSWSGRKVADASPEACKKSNSTGFSKIWRFRDLVMRSSSDGKDAFVFLNNNNVRSQTRAKQGGEKDIKKKKTKKERTKKGTEKKVSKAGTATASAHERLYMMKKAMKEEGKRKSYLPYKQVGFFANVNGLSRNIHPF